MTIRSKETLRAFPEGATAKKGSCLPHLSTKLSKNWFVLVPMLLFAGILLRSSRSHDGWWQGKAFSWQFHVTSHHIYIYMVVAADSRLLVEVPVQGPSTRRKAVLAFHIYVGIHNNSHNRKGSGRQD